ncbi:hypothetical protein CHS0354_032142 [Potamilus streckersoni]|uniref:Uncharacterized protein n=1 Tax=Potamilus streckersoni TaxID=2493646 RepID=A0AAE0TGN2_9BIVA|nr:hypothetical protein CHS0354_032142 [Potamilus streckersoni]
MVLRSFASVVLSIIIHCVVEYKGVSGIRCYNCKYDVLYGDGDSNCLKTTANEKDCQSPAWSCYVRTTHSEGKRDVQSVTRGCGSGDSGCSESCSNCIRDTCYTVCTSSLCNTIDSHVNGVGDIGKSTRAISRLILSMLILFCIKLLPNYFL